MGLFRRLLLGLETDDNLNNNNNNMKNRCGGTDRYIDKNAKTEILSDDMCLFDVTSILNSNDYQQEDYKTQIRKISCFASKSGEGIFLLFSKGVGYNVDSTSFNWAYIKEDIFPSLVELVKKYDFVKKNGHISKTHGLPRDFGGNVNILYSSGEKIYFSNNQSPVITKEAGLEILNIFETYSEKEKMELPNLDDLISIRYIENRINGGYTKTKLSIYSDGTGLNYKESKYSDDKIYDSEKNVESSVISNIKDIINTNGILAWGGFMKTEPKVNQNATIFDFRDGREIRIDNNYIIPSIVNGALFKIQLELTTKN